MSNTKEQANSKPNDKKKEITIKIREVVWNRINSQLEFLNAIAIPELSEIKTIEDLIVFYIEQLALPPNQISDTKKKLAQVFSEFEDRGVNMKALLHSFTTEEEEIKDDDGWEEEDS